MEKTNRNPKVTPLACNRTRKFTSSLQSKEGKLFINSWMIHGPKLTLDIYGLTRSDYLQDGGIKERKESLFKYPFEYC